MIGKFAAKLDFLSLKFIAVYCGVFFILGIYALLWQQVLKHISLTTAIANKSITIIWGLIAGYFLFHESITKTKILGAILILCGIFILSFQSSSDSVDDKNTGV
ncbi:drug/metabolite transporter (DMT)-like permease [Treponema rectale]|uniref:Drug/metabolite transporter (DMT)-like permease n=1 Tax=Treponema rectale TaxID=744512 RepID=A0A840S770_9SPIR|nr:drug/metabolite transporter (DMT)-like permease [Treponema rectale]